MSDRIEELFARWVEHDVVHGERLDPAELCRDDPELLDRLREVIAEYEALDDTLASPDEVGPVGDGGDARLPTFEGFRTVERLGGGGAGDVYKLVDVELGRTVAAKVIRPDNPVQATLDDFLREARTMALFEDPRIVRVLEFRRRSDPPVLVMEHVDGFPLNRVGRSLELAQRARVMLEIAEAVDRAHGLGIQHRDLKPGNVLLDADLRPKILDFGLSRGEPDRGHGVGTLAYMAPEQLDPSRPIDDRTDVYALGVMLYELLCGTLPYGGTDRDGLVVAIRTGPPRLPVEIEPSVPEPLQAIALKAMEREPEDRYPSARAMAEELRRFLDGRPVLARPTPYRSALDIRLREHLDHVREWLRLKLIYPHEAERLVHAYRRLEAREDDWIVAGRVLSLSQVALYLGAFVLLCGSLLYFVAYLSEAIEGLAGPTVVLGLPFVGLNVAAELLYRRGRRAVAVAFHLAAVVLLPIFLLIAFQEVGLAPPGVDDPDELFGDAGISNRQLQIASALAGVWACWLALRTRTVGLSVSATVMAFVFHLAVLADRGLRSWFEDGSWDLLALHLVPFLAAAATAGAVLERRDRAWFAQPLYYAAVLVFVAVLELLALNGKAFGYLGVSIAPLQGPDVSDPTLLDTCAAMTLNGVLIYLAGVLLERHGSRLLAATAWLSYWIAPFAILEPIAWINHVGEYSRRFDWIYLALAVTIAWLSHVRQRKSFYFAGLINTGMALWLITDHYEWFDRPAWSTVVVAAGLAVLVVGFRLAAREHARRAPAGGDQRSRS